MDEYADADIYYVDTRNASRDHRRPGSSSGSVPWRPVPPPSGRPVFVPPTQLPAPIVYAPPMQQYPQYPVQQFPGQSPFGNLFGKLTAGQVIEMVAQLFAALQPLPAAPAPTGESATNSANLILFQDALAKHAKLDERVRMVGGLVSKLVG